MSEFYNELYSSVDAFRGEIAAVCRLPPTDRNVVAGGLAEVWMDFELVFGDGDGFRAADADERTRYRLDLLRTAEVLGREDRALEARGVKLLSIYLRGLSNLGKPADRRMEKSLRRLLETGLRQRAAGILSANTGSDATVH